MIFDRYLPTAYVDIAILHAHIHRSAHLYLLCCGIIFQKTEIIVLVIAVIARCCITHDVQDT